ncbi:energy transducer TonB [Kordia sp.]|uniref:energy transducer TonB n=1 Tax=Kordia sp. TaxID=1965332 RepID=UPI003B5A853A
MKNTNYTKSVDANSMQQNYLTQKDDLKIQKSPFLRFSVSLALSLFIVYTVFQVQISKEVALADAITIIEDDTYYIPIITEEVIEVEELKPEPIHKPIVIANEIKAIDDDLKIKDEVLKTSADPVEVTDKFDPNAVAVIDEGAEENKNIEIPIDFVENAPIFPGCEKYKDKNKQKKCMSDKIRKHINRKFNTGIASDVGLDEGVKRINILFVIDENGNVTGIQARAPHPKLQKEAERVVRSLPKMIPGKQDRKNVKVKYTLPIIFRVD